MYTTQFCFRLTGFLVASYSRLCSHLPINIDVKQHNKDNTHVNLSRVRLFFASLFYPHVRYIAIVTNDLHFIRS